MHTFYPTSPPATALQTTPDPSGEFPSTLSSSAIQLLPWIWPPLPPRPLDSRPACSSASWSSAFVHTSFFPTRSVWRLRDAHQTPIRSLIRKPSGPFTANLPESSSRYRPKRGLCQTSSPPPNPPPRQPGAEPRSRHLPHSLDGDELLRLPHHSSSSGSGRAHYETWLPASDEIVGHPAKRYFCLKLLALSTYAKSAPEVPNPQSPLSLSLSLKLPLRVRSLSSSHPIRHQIIHQDAQKK